MTSSRKSRAQPMLLSRSNLTTRSSAQPSKTVTSTLSGTSSSTSTYLIHPASQSYTLRPMCIMQTAPAIPRPALARFASRAHPLSANLMPHPCTTPLRSEQSYREHVVSLG
uniref:Uncharacterized protein n=2 Tax=Arundo donax TaxID=35708 RepID=A0A0A9FKE0_ARUDO